jgi:DNA-binding beta-propeller fold protein YncE
MPRGSTILAENPTDMAPTNTLALGALALLATSAPAASLTRTGTIPLPDVTGRIDHFAVDRAGARLFVAALGSDRVEVVDLRRGAVVHTIGGLAEPQGVLFNPAVNRLYVANGGDGTLRSFDGANFAAGPVIKLDGDADNVRGAPDGRTIYVGYGDGALAIVDAAGNEVLGTIPLPAHPESFQLSQDGSRIFVNVPGAHMVAVVDRQSRQVVGRWSPGQVSANFPLALDQAGQRAFVGCRSPARLLVYDTASGHEIAALALHADCDDLFFDSRRHRIYAACGAGYLDVFADEGANRCRLVEAVRTAAGARTCLMDGDRIYVAVPRAGQHEAHIQVFGIAE